MRPVYDEEVGGGRLRVLAAEPLATDLSPFEAGDQRLVVLVDADVLWADPLNSYIFEKVVGPRGRLCCVRSDDDRALALDLASPMDDVTRWLAEERRVTVACDETIPASLVVAAVTIASGSPFADGLDHVRKVMPGSLSSADDEIRLSVVLDHWRDYRDLQRRRDQAEARGESRWSVQ